MTGTRNHSGRARRGFTLIELMITVSLFMIIITIAVGAFTNALRTQRQVSTLISSESNVSLAVEQMARDIRTGYLFCHGVNSNTESGCDNPQDTTFPQCVINGATNVWTCPALTFYDAESDVVTYSLQNGALVETVNSSTPQAITSDDVRVQYLQFRLFGQLEGDNWTPRITIVMGMAPSSTGDVGIANDVFNLETTVSAREIDCSTTGGTTQC